MRLLVFIGFLLIASCGGPRPVLEVDQFHLRDDSEGKSFPSFEDQVVGADRLRHLHGSVSAEERNDRLGDYYTIRWRGPEGLENEEVRIVFDYRQGATGRTVKTKEKRLPAAAGGSCEFILNGEAYQKGGRVLAWRVRYYRGDQLVTTKRSYLWE